MKANKSLLLAAAIGGLTLAGCSSSANSTSPNDKVMCYGVNGCKGHGDCAGKVDACDSKDGCQSKSSCHGKNSCKGKGFKKMTRKECEAKGGKVSL